MRGLVPLSAPVVPRVLRLARCSPARLVPAVYAAAWAAGTVGLWLPVSSVPDAHVGWWEAAFTSMSALCITGLGVVDTGTAWTHTGQVVLLALVQVGGFGIMTLTSVILFTLLGRSSRAAAMVAQTETRADHREIAQIPRRILLLTLVVEAGTALVLSLRLLWLGTPPARAVYHGVFHAVSAFNNAGFALYPDNLASFGGDSWIIVPVCVAVVVGGIGFPVWMEVLARRSGRRRMWSLHVHLTLLGTAILLAAGAVAFVLFEWTNPGTLGKEAVSQRVLGVVGGTVFPRTAGFSTIDYGHAATPTILVSEILMMVGGGSAGTAGGIKVATAAVLIVVVGSQVKGERDVLVGHRRLSASVIRQALSVTILASGVVMAVTVVMSAIEPFPLEEVSFEAVSAFSNTGLSMGITAKVGHASWALLIILMFLGRVGPVSAVAALTLRERARSLTYPEEDPLIG